jgi:microcystin-dependent protein
MFGFGNFAPAGVDVPQLGKLLPISENETLFN